MYNYNVEDVSVGSGGVFMWIIFCLVYLIIFLVEMRFRRLYWVRFKGIFSKGIVIFNVYSLYIM